MAPDLLEGVTADDLREAFLRAMAPRPSVHVETEHIAPIRISVADAVVELVSEIPRTGSVTFRYLTRSLVDRIEIAVRFLAVLEPVLILVMGGIVLLIVLAILMPIFEMNQLIH